MKRYRIIVAGSRTITDKEAIHEYLSYHLRNFPREDILIIHGGAKGPDLIAEDWAKKEGVEYLAVPAIWDDLTDPCILKHSKVTGYYNALAGNKRNIKMAEMGTHLVAIWDGESSGTRDMINQARKNSLGVHICTSIKSDVPNLTF